MVGNSLDSKAKAAIVEAIRGAEKNTSGEIRVHVTKKACGDSMAEAKKMFEKLGMHRTKLRNGVLLFISLKDHTFTILGDQGIHERVGDSFWAQTRDKMVQHFSGGRLEEGIVTGVWDAGKKLEEFFPFKAGDKNELKNEVTEN